MISHLKMLNLYGGLGGNRKKIEGVEVTTVELNPKIAEVYRKLYPQDNLVVGDAHQYLLDHADEYDIIWSSPPCQSHSRMVKATRHKIRKYPDMRLYEEIIFLQHFFKGLWVVENVKPYYTPLIEPTAVLGRHYFWASFPISHFEVPQPKGFITSGSVKASEGLKDWLGIHYEGNLYYDGNHCPGQVLRNCVHPDVGLHVYNQMLNGLK
jgi:DNA (cytosine-5)-methyltransferase 1